RGADRSDPVRLAHRPAPPARRGTDGAARRQRARGAHGDGSPQRVGRRSGSARPDGGGGPMRTRARLRRGVYIIPSLFTTGNLLCGYIAVVRSLQGDYEWAALAVFIAALLDRADGWVARLTRTSTEFGVQLDS